MSENPISPEQRDAIQQELKAKKEWILKWQERVKSAFTLDAETIISAHKHSALFPVINDGFTIYLVDGSCWWITTYKDIDLPDFGRHDVIQFNQRTSNPAQPVMARLVYESGTEYQGFRHASMGWGKQTTPAFYEMAEIRGGQLRKMVRTTVPNNLFPLPAGSRLMPSAALQQTIDARFQYDGERFVKWNGELAMDGLEVKVKYQNGVAVDRSPLLASVGFPAEVDVMPHIKELFKQKASDPLCA